MTKQYRNDKCLEFAREGNTIQIRHDKRIKNYRVHGDHKHN